MNITMLSILSKMINKPTICDNMAAYLDLNIIRDDYNKKGVF